ncbi:YARHG domain-containing protein [Halobacillus sp. A1]|uniref:YARHG domain-containing protein n=1 Tax=Halobacillus sp. A1 TaxID=2880262 RepID=UPI0020A6C76F|nr:YARHG domain-containing protein [Halobacillus sp. A1]MCP3032516.1 YARHG domain-containing protein [Halobacillus sp. A1]
MEKCKSCGHKLNKNQTFCTGCGEKVSPPSQSRTEVKRTTRSKRSTLPLLLGLFVVIGIGLFFGWTYYFSPENELNANSTQPKENMEEAPDSQPEQQNLQSEDDLLIQTEEQLNQLQIDLPGRNISLGEWSITREDQMLYVEAHQIPAHELDNIFNLFDKDNLTPLENWAEDVFDTIDQLSIALEEEWHVYVGNSCTEEYPEQLPSEDLLYYSGSCGYSIPVLTGTSEEDYTLIIHERVFGSDPQFEPTEVVNADTYFLPESHQYRLSKQELTHLTKNELRLARNEIFARHGYIFESKDLQQYFSQKTWYVTDVNYDGTLSPIEKYNVDLMKELEDD